MQTKLRILTGLHIGGSDDTMKIGGIDSAVIKREVFTNEDGTINYDGTGKKITEPYIPGSSLKGKMRSLTEWLTGSVLPTGKVHTCGVSTCPVCRTFGRGANDSRTAASGPTRLIIRDAYLTEDSKKELTNLKARTGLDTEMKYENTINRIDSKANPRNMERVPMGTKFELAD